MLPIIISRWDTEIELESVDLPLVLGDLVPAAGGWEVELGFGKGRYLLDAARTHPESGFLGVELASRYHRLARSRARRRGLRNLVLIRGEALYLMAALLPAGFADCVHVYFPDPWPKPRHQKRRLFDPESLDLVLGLLRTGGRLFFATDFLDYGEEVATMLETHPVVEVSRRQEAWPGGPRTNYEAKYVREGRPILRLEAVLQSHSREALIHPQGRAGLVCALATGSAEAREQVLVGTAEGAVD